MQMMHIKDKNSKKRVFIIAEAGVNHNGSLDMARLLIDVAASAGADAVKFQTFRADRMISKCAPLAEYQKKTIGEAKSQLDMVRELELDVTAHHTLMAHCRLRDVEFLSAPFDLESIDFLARDMNLPRLKIPSGEITNGPYLLHLARTGKPVILSTGMSTLSEVETALGVLAFGYLRKSKMPSLEMFRDAYCSEEGRRVIAKRVILLHCTTEYPAPFPEVNLRAMETMRQAFLLPVGLSDHTPGIAVPIAAVALGATVIEKHFTLDKSLSGPDHQASLDPEELKAMVAAIRQIEMALGDGLKIPSSSEMRNRTIARKSLAAGRPLAQDETLSPADLEVKRPGKGISPMNYWDLLGTKTQKAYKQDELITR